MTTRNVFDTVLKSNDLPWPNYPVTFWRAPSSYVADATYPEDRITVFSDSNGEWNVDLWVNTEGIIGSVYIVQLHDEDFMFNLVPGLPVSLTQLRGTAPGGSGITSSTLVAWVAGENYEFTFVTYDSVYPTVIASATVKWGDGSTGIYTTTAINATFELVDAFTITHTASGKTVTQAAVTRNADGLVILKPAMTVA